LNSDGNERGFLDPGGTQDLQTLISDVAKDIQDPETNMTVFQRSHLASIAQAKNDEERKDLHKRTDLIVDALGDGSDYTAFQDFAGISTLSIEFGGENDGTQYHSIYDDFYWYTHFVDGDFIYGKALAQTAGTTVMRLADADLIPVDYSPQAEAIAKYETELEKNPQRQAGRIYRAQPATERRGLHCNLRPAPSVATATCSGSATVHETLLP
jgi:N-acetylated-alpha-linked acidic dipeptidase